MNAKQSASGIILCASIWAATGAYGHKPIPEYRVEALRPTSAKGRIEAQLRRYIEDDYIAEEIAKSKHPILLAAIAKVESNYIPNARGKNGEQGMFQIRAEIHDSYSGRTIASQVKSCEAIILPLIKKHGFRKGIERYNGSGEASRKYAEKVIRTINAIKRA